jgi:hypothetical protein
MARLYRRFVRRIRDIGVNLFCHFNDISDRTDSFGSWGASEYQDVDGIKMQVLLSERPVEKNALKGTLNKIKRIFKRENPE